MAMLVNFTIRNWASFRDTAEFNLAATREKQHRDRIAFSKKLGLRVLPVSLIFGGNASGKTNLFKALNFSQIFVVMGVQPDEPIPVAPFALDETAAAAPSEFAFDLLIDDTLYSYSFAATEKRVEEEKLVEYGPRERLLFHRAGDARRINKSLPRQGFLKYVLDGTRPNQLVVTNGASQGVDAFKPVYHWFRNTLQLIAPDSRFKRFERFFDIDDPLCEAMNETLARLDTGIVKLDGVDMPLEYLPIDDKGRQTLLSTIREGETLRVMAEPAFERFVITRKNGSLRAKRLVSRHAGADGKPVGMSMRDESDGTRRVIDLLPAFHALVAQREGGVYVIDEVDRSLHTELTRSLLESYLLHCGADSRTQLLCTTHDALLLDQELLRRDEVWFAERDHTGASRLSSLGDFKSVRYDKDIRKSYLLGRFSGVPNITPFHGVLEEAKVGNAAAGDAGR
jgi:predicted ATPase